MNIRNNVFVKVTAVIFMMTMTGIFCASVYDHFFKQMYGSFLIGVFAGGLLLLLGFALIIAFFGTSNRENNNRHIFWSVLEAITVAGMMIYGIVLRCKPQIVYGSTNMSYFDLSALLQKGIIHSDAKLMIDSILHMPSLFFYGKLTSLSFSVFGSKPEVMFFGNMIFQTAGIFFLYRIVRRLAGGLCGVISVLISVYMPAFIFSVYNMDNSALVFFFLFGVLWLYLLFNDLPGENIKLRTYVWKSGLSGALLGLLIFIEPVTLIPVLILLILLFFMKKKGLQRGFAAILTGVAAFALLTFWMSSSLSLPYVQCIQAYADSMIPDFMAVIKDNAVVSPKELIDQYSVILSETGSDIYRNYESLRYQDGVILSTSFAGLMLVINHFCYLWIVLTAFLFAMYLLIDRSLTANEMRAVPFMWLNVGILAVMFLYMNRMYHTTYFLGMLSIVSCTALRYMYLAFIPLPKPNQQVTDTEETVQQESGLEELQKPVEQEIAKEELPEPIEQPEIHYIENPLPLPKKKVKRGRIDFAVVVPEEQMKYDVEVPEDADWNY